MMGFAVVILLVVGTRLHDWFDRPNIEGIKYPTGIEDNDYYTGLGDDDFSQPNLKFWGAPDGWVRESISPSPKKDEYMQKIPDPRTGRFTQDLSRRYFLYHYEKEEIDDRTGLPGQVYVKAGQNQYIAFVPATPVESDSSLRERIEPATPSGQP